nr:keratin-associated protein 5-3-like [Cherax quadricarinatus]
MSYSSHVPSEDCDDQGACDGGHGVCRESCLRLERQVQCSINPVCDEGYGVCREFCLKEELEVKDGCGDSACKCCSSRLATCNASNSCSGICTDKIVMIKVLVMAAMECAESPASAWRGQVQCYAQPICNGSNGVCRERCYSGELEVEGGCISPGCKCCTPRYTNCPVTNNCSGVCMDVKLCKNPLANNSCIGSDCICCDKCSINPVCDEGYGVCREFCLKEELEVKDGCGDSACKCCSSRLATCNASNSCSGICTDVRTCTNPLGNNCSGLNCVCCDNSYLQVLVASWVRTSQFLRPRMSTGIWKLDVLTDDAVPFSLRPHTQYKIHLGLNSTENLLNSYYLPSGNENKPRQ